ncbi:type III restriction enzyme, res subunit [Magnetococcus marinus MC-1]|uniref:Type III restriction enzyme, res subunit n=1 Tax=Magnetococcus marinus (strain ATCC BAA-1437 / JCM 17883 / MC-1) TaxID=156889 RepID=A0LBR5_MAGMM|nr:DEAD/DEAH box helicase [Magnetococcus marinus]ABK45408.1 type III restriction enzyme, res subunit [Magnetococcus marinus MC-1]
MLELRPYQRQAIDAIYAYFQKKTGNCLICIPTAGGKSLVMATFIREAIEHYPETRILVVTHVRELISQNHAELMGIWPDAPAGIHSAGLGARDVDAQVLFCGIQSVHKRAYDIQRCDLVLVDEAHLIPRTSNTMYRKFLEELTVINPYMKIIGFTATPYRLDSGLLHKGKDALFDDIAFDVPINDLIDEGFLSPLISKKTDTQLDVSGVGTRGGEFIAGQLEAAVDQADVTRAAVEEIIALGQDRRAWLLFCSGVAHAEHVRDAVKARGYSCEGIFGHTPKEERDGIIEAFRAGQIRALAAMNVLTTGFNVKSVDLIAMLRPTQSAGLYVQIAGRGTRLHPEKENCLVLDFAGNVARHGPIDQIQSFVKKDKEEPGEAPQKVCPACQAVNPAAVQYCIECDFEFPPPEIKINATATTKKILSSGKPEWVRVHDIVYKRHQKEGKPPSLRVEYMCGLQWHKEWVCFEHEGYARQKAVQWWFQRVGLTTPVPNSVGQALTMVDDLPIPDEIKIRSNGKFIEIMDCRFHDKGGDHDRSNAA